MEMQNFVHSQAPLSAIPSAIALCFVLAVGAGCDGSDQTYSPDQQVFAQSIAVGDGLRNLEPGLSDQGHQNTVVGLGAGVKLTTGKYNTLIGANSGRDMTAETVATTYSPHAGIGNLGNTFVGRNTAMVANGALDNTGIGVNVMQNLTTGMDNFAGGINALQLIEGGSENAAVGHGSLQHVIGHGTFEDGDGHRNTAAGDMAGRLLNDLAEKTGGKASVYVGARTTSLSNNVINENVFGYEAKGRGTNTASYGNDSISGHYFNGGPIMSPAHAVTSEAANVYIDPSTGEIKRSEVAVREFVRATTSTDDAVSLSAGAAVSTVTIELDAGAWDVSGVGVFDGDPSTSVNYLVVGVSERDAELPHAFDTASRHIPDAAIFSIGSARVAAPTRRLTLTERATIHLVTTASFAAGSTFAHGRIEARRVR